ncbi:MAG: endonuclease III [Bacteroidaceae bacterium]|nr:endonuclease III [Bacteroidaceae bacterium]
MKTKDRYDFLIRYFQETMPVAESELNYSTPFELLVAVILSAQCTDKRINQITPPLFRDYPTPEAMAQVTPDIIYKYIRSVSYPNNKAKHLVGMAQMLVRDYGGIVPSTGEELEKLPGVGRKTANVIQAVIFQKARMAVDTHVFRVSHRLGLAGEKCTTPLSVEKQLMKHLPEDIIPLAHHWLLLHGRYVCQSRKPQCEKCGLREVCKHFLAKGLQM